MSAIIKICGIQNVSEALGAVTAGANTIGLLLGVSHAVEDEITPETGKRIAAAMPGEIRIVLVTHLLDIRRIASLATHAGASAIQVHNDLSVGEIRELRKLVPDKELIKTVHVAGDDAVRKALAYSSYVDMLLLDSRTEDRLGGTGQTHDWNVSRRIVQAVDIPVLLAGGLNPENVEAAIHRVKPAGIDANSGLEHKDGSKDFDKIRAFVKAGKLCALNH